MSPPGIVPSFRKCRISAGSCPQGRFGLDGPRGGPKHVAEIERRRCIRRIAFHEEAIEPLGFGNVAHLLRSMGEATRGGHRARLAVMDEQ